MFDFFKWKAKKIQEEALAESAPVCNCGSWPDPTWKYEDFIKKNEAIKLCPVHNHMTPVMVIRQSEPTVPEVFDFDTEIRAARLHIVNAQQALGYLSRHDLMKDLELLQDAIEGIIEERKI